MKAEARPALQTVPPDVLYLLALVGLVSLGILMVYSTSAVPHAPPKGMPSDTPTAIASGWDGLKKMILVLGIGGLGAWIAAVLPVKVWRKLTPAILVVTVLLLASLLLPKGMNPWAYGTKGAVRWLLLPGGFQFQPSEFAKLAFVLFAAQFLEKRGTRLGVPEWGFFLGMLGFLGALIYLEPDLGTALVLGGTAFFMLLAGGARFKHLMALLLVAAVGVGTLAWTKGHQRDRLLAWRDPWHETNRHADGYQVVQSYLAMARGGWLGVGLGQSTFKVDDRLPEAETDFVFAIVAEEQGLVGGVVVLGLFGLFIWRGYGIAARAPDRYTYLVSSGLTSWVMVQTLLNIGVVTGTLPNTGVPLPFISAGGSSMLALLAASGIMIGVSRKRAPEAAQTPS